MFYMTRIAAVSPSSVRNMTRHLMNATLGLDQNIEAIQLIQGESVELDWFRLAAAVCDGSLLRSEAIAELMQPWLRTANAATGGVFDHADIVQRQIEDRFDVLKERMDAGTVFAPLAILRPDMEAGVSRGLGILPGMLLAKGNIDALLAGRRIDGSHIPGKSYAEARDDKAPIGSYDFCCMAPKSFSVAWAFASPAEQAKLMALHMQAAREGAAYLADELGVAHFGWKHDERVEGAIAWIEFTHHTARKVKLLADAPGGDIAVRDSGQPGDPSVHTHFVFPNAVFTPDGRVGTIQAYQVGGVIKEAGGFYQARLGVLLRDAGYDALADDRTAGFIKMPVIPDRAADNYSKRRNYGELLARRYTEQQGEVWEDLAAAQRSARIAAAIDNVYQLRSGEKDDRADFGHWRQQARDIGWEPPKSFQLIGPQTAPLTATERHVRAYEVAIHHLEPKFAQRAVLSHYDLRYAALLGLIETGTTTRDSRGRIADIDAVTKLMREQGVTQYGERTPLVWGREADGSVSVTTGLHIEQEKELIERLRHAHADTSGKLDRAVLDRHIAASGLDFTGAHGKSQRDALTRVATGSRFELVIGAAGSGKTTSMKPLIAARREQGWQIHGVSLAWQQADELADIGINPRAVHAFSVLMDKLASGKLRLGPKSLVVLDEYGLLGTRQGLELLRYQNALGFSIVALGDQKQLSSVESGNLIDLTKRALGAEAVPAIETTKRQSGREAEISSLLRQGKAAEAIAMKREDGTARLAYGGRAGTVKAVAELYMQRLAETGRAPSISTPTNKDANQISLAIRDAKQVAGMVGPDLVHKKATDGKEDYVMRFAKGDRIRLFRSTGGVYFNPETKRTTGGSIGRNGSVLTVVEVNRDGLLVETSSGKRAAVDWAQFTNTHTGRVLLAYGDATTIHRSQGSTAKEHIWALLDGAKAIAGNAGYSAATRHKLRSYLITNAEQEYISVKQSRAINDPAPVTDDDRWGHVAQRLSWQPEKDTATALAERVTALSRGTVDLLHRVTELQSDIMLRDPHRLAENAAEIVQLRRLDSFKAMLHRSAEVIRGVFARDHDR